MKDVNEGMCEMKLNGELEDVMMKRNDVVRVSGAICLYYLISV